MLAPLFNQLLLCINCYSHLLCFTFLRGRRGGEGGGHEGVGRGRGRGGKQSIPGQLIIFGSLSRQVKPTTLSHKTTVSKDCALSPHLQSHSLHWLPYSPCWQSPACLTPSLASPHPRFHDWLRLILLQQKVIINQDAGAQQESFRKPRTA